MHKHSKFTHTWQFWLAAVVAGVLLPLLASHGVALAADTPQSDGENEVYGFVQEMPAGFVGQWRVNNVLYISTATTEVKQENGDIAGGSCVKLHVSTDGTNTIREVESELNDRCTGSPGGDDNGDDNGGGPGGGDDGPNHDADDDNGVDSTPGSLVPDENEMYSTIITFPVGLVGLWQIGEFTFTTSITTEFDQRNGAFGEGVLVKVEYFAQRGRHSTGNRNQDRHHAGCE